MTEMPILDTDKLIPSANQAHKKSADSSEAFRKAKQKLDEIHNHYNIDPIVRRDRIEKDWDLQDATYNRKYFTAEAVRIDSLITRETARQSLEIQKKILETQEAILETQKAILAAVKSNKTIPASRHPVDVTS